MGTLVQRKKTYRYSSRKVMEFSQLMADILVYEFCKFEMYIFEIAQAIGDNVPIAFLNVLSIFIFAQFVYIKINDEKAEGFELTCSQTFTPVCSQSICLHCITPGLN